MSSLLLFFCACTNDVIQCETALSVTGNNYTSSSYKAAVKTALEDFLETRYYLNQYIKIRTQEFLLVDVKSAHGRCFKAMFRVMPDVALADIRKTQGLGYSGAELKGLQFESKLQADTISFIITKVEKTVD